MRIQIWTPKLNTGGPWALIQLSDALKTHGIEVNLIDPRIQVPGFDDLAAQRIRDSQLTAHADAVIAPELWARQLLALRGVSRVLWWLSVDNAYRPGGDRLYDWISNRLIYDKYVRLCGRTLIRLIERADNGDVIHATQSEYARRHVTRELRRPAVMLTDYLTDSIADVEPAGSADPRFVRVLYNGTKGLPAARRVVAASDGHLPFVAIEGLTRPETIDLLKTSAIYLDLGPHPGRDRLPREAAACGCVVVVSHRGSARNGVDLPIPRCYKVVTPTRVSRAASAVARQLTDILADLPEHQRAMDGYRRSIRPQEHDFRREVAELVQVLHGRCG